MSIGTVIGVIGILVFLAGIIWWVAASIYDHIHKLRGKHTWIPLIVLICGNLALQIGNLIVKLNN